jgi:K+-sensing histidine kinase KdpD
MFAGTDRRGKRSVGQGWGSGMTKIRWKAGERRSRLVTDADKQRLWILKSISTKMSDHGVLAVNLGNQPAQVTEELNRRIDALLAEASLVLTRIDAASALANASGRQRSDVLKTALIGTASHELRSPIAAILGSASVLDRVPALQADAKLRSLVQGMHHDAMRLDHDLQNILDGARITDNGIAPKFALMDPADTVAAAIKKRSHRIAFHRLKLDIEADLPLINVDSGLLEQALGQILENAAKYSPPNSEISIRARTEDRQVVLAISDQGVGLTDEEARELFNRHFAGGVTPT